MFEFCLNLAFRRPMGRGACYFPQFFALSPRAVHGNSGAVVNRRGAHRGPYNPSTNASIAVQYNWSLPYLLRFLQAQVPCSSDSNTSFDHKVEVEEYISTVHLIDDGNHVYRARLSRGFVLRESKTHVLRFESRVVGLRQSSVVQPSPTSLKA